MSIAAMEAADDQSPQPLAVNVNAPDSRKNAYVVLDSWHQTKQIPAAFIWPHPDAQPSPTTAALDVPVVNLGVALRSTEGMRRAAAQVAAACTSNGLFQATGHSVSPAMARAALAGAADFFRLPLVTKQRAQSAPGTVTGYASAHAGRFTANLPWKETLSFGHHHADGSGHVVDFFTSTLGDDFKPLGEVYQEYCQAMEEMSLAIMEVLGVSLGLGRGYYRDFFADGSATMRCNYYPRCPEPERALGTGPHRDPSALTILLQDGQVDGLQVLVDGAWRWVRPKPGHFVVNIGETFTALSNGRYKSCIHRAVVHRDEERRSLAYFLCPRKDRAVCPPPSLALVSRLYPDFMWADLMRFTQHHYRSDTGTLEAFMRWLGPSNSPPLSSSHSSTQAQGTI